MMIIVLMMKDMSFQKERHYVTQESFQLFYVITSYEDAQKYIGRKAEKNRKIYNGMLKTYLYQFMGPKPPKRPKRED